MKESSVGQESDSETEHKTVEVSENVAQRKRKILEHVGALLGREEYYSRSSERFCCLMWS